MAVFIFVVQQRHRSDAASGFKWRYSEELSANNVFFELFFSIGDGPLQGQVKMESRDAAERNFTAHGFDFKLACGCFNGTSMSESPDVRIHCKPWNKPA
jgi:hypothetical protein